MAKNSLNIPFALLISLLVIASVIIIKGELKKNRFQIETVKTDISMLKNQSKSGEHQFIFNLQ